MRTALTEEEAVHLSEAGERFCVKLGEMTAEILAEFPPAVHEVVLERLQDATSLYNPLTHDAMTRKLRLRRGE